MPTETKETIQREFQNWEIDSITAIERLQKLFSWMTQREAEQVVYSWGDEEEN